MVDTFIRVCLSLAAAALVVMFSAYLMAGTMYVTHTHETSAWYLVPMCAVAACVGAYVWRRLDF